MNGAEDSGENTVLTFRVGEGEYGIALPWVWGVREAGFRQAGNETEIEYRGERLPLVDLTRWLGSGEGGQGSSLLIVGRVRARAALRVDRAGTVVRAAGGVRPWPDS